MQIQEVFDRRRFVFLDGGMGTQLQQRGLQPGQKPELAALEMPDVLTAIHRDYAAAGADILLANTFGANAKKLAGCGHSVEEVVSASIACARRAGQETGALVALDIGPLGELLAPAGTLAFEDAYEEFAQIIRAGAAAGAAFSFGLVAPRALPMITMNIQMRISTVKVIPSPISMVIADASIFCPQVRPMISSGFENCSIKLMLSPPRAECCRAS